MMMITCLILWMPVSDARSGLADPVTFLGPVQAAKAHDPSTATIARHASQLRPIRVTMSGQRCHRAVCPGPDAPDQQAPQPPWWGSRERLQPRGAHSAVSCAQGKNSVGKAYEG